MYIRGGCKRNEEVKERKACEYCLIVLQQGNIPFIFKIDRYTVGKYPFFYNIVIYSITQTTEESNIDRF